MEFDQWLGVELRHLAALQAVAEAGSFRAAAARLGYTQSAISQQVAALERAVGARLVERPGGPRPVYLTECGKLVLRHAEAIMARLEAAKADVAAALAGGAGLLRVGSFQSAGARILPELVRRFAAAFPSVEVRLEESASDYDLLESVERGDLDLSFVMLPLPEGPFAIVELVHDPWVLLVPAGSPLAAREQPVTLREIAGLPLIGARLCRSQELVHAHFLARGLEPSYVFHSDENTTIHGLVAAGAGIALVPRLCVDVNDRRVTALEIGTKVPPRVIGLAWHADRYRPPAARGFVELAEAFCAELRDGAGPPLAATA